MEKTIQAHRLIIAILAAMIACGPRRVEVVETIARGSLQCIEKVERRRVNNYWWELLADNRPFLPEDRDSNIVGNCRVSRNPQVTAIVFLLGDSCWRFHMEGGSPRATPIENSEGMDSIEQFKTGIWSCNGHCLVWRTLLVFVDTGEVRKFTHPLPDDLIGLSPDLKTAVGAGTENDATHISIDVVDTETGSVTNKILKRDAHAWLLDYREGRDAIAEHFKWRKIGGRDVLEYP